MYVYSRDVDDAVQGGRYLGQSGHDEWLRGRLVSVIVRTKIQACSLMSLDGFVLAEHVMDAYIVLEVQRNF